MSTTPETPTSSAELTSDDLPSLDIVFDLTRERLATQLAHVDSLDNKASFVLGSATLLTAAVVAFHTNPTRLPGWLVYTCLGVALVLYVAVVFMAYAAYITRSYKISPTPDGLEPYMWMDPVRTKGTVVREMVIDYSKNRQEIAKKARWLKWAQWAFGAQAIMLAILALLQVID